MLLDSNKIFNI